MSDVEGLDHLIRDFTTTGAAVHPLFGLAISKTALDIEADGKVLAPVDTGFLQNSITTDVDETTLTAEIGPEAEYGGYVELGTSRMAPQPFMRPAADRRFPELVEAAGEISMLGMEGR
jgi:HK97 gp10 family phage protein